MWLAVRLYALLVWLLPSPLRRRQGDAMCELFIDLLASARECGESGVLRPALHGLLDLLLRIPYEHVRLARGGHSGEGVMLNSVGFELRQGLRILRRQPATSFLVAGMLALGIAANTVVFSFINTVFLRPLPWDQPDRLVYLNERAPRWNLDFTGINYPDFLLWRNGARAFESMALYAPDAFNVAEGGVAERLEGVAVTYDYLSVLRITPLLGRGFTAAEDRHR